METIKRTGNGDDLIAVTDGERLHLEVRANAGFVLAVRIIGLLIAASGYLLSVYALIITVPLGLFLIYLARPAATRPLFILDRASQTIEKQLPGQETKSYSVSAPYHFVVDTDLSGGALGAPLRLRYLLKIADTGMHSFDTETDAMAYGEAMAAYFGGNVSIEGIAKKGVDHGA